MNKPLGGEVGRPVPQLEAQEKVSGSAQFIADLYRPNMLYGAVLQSPHAHARILAYDVTRARAIRGRARHRYRRRCPGHLAHGGIHQGRACAGERQGPLCRRTGRRRRRRYRGHRPPGRRRDRRHLSGTARHTDAGRGAGTGRRRHPRARRRLHQGVRRRHQGQPVFAHQLPRRRHRARLARQRSRVRSPLPDPTAGACVARAVRRARRDGRQRPHHLVVGEPVGVSRPGQRLGVARLADVAAALPDPAGRRRLRQQDGAAHPADHGVAGHESQAAGQAHPVARTGLRDGPRAPPVQNSQSRPG